MGEVHSLLIHAHCYGLSDETLTVTTVKAPLSHRNGKLATRDQVTGRLRITMMSAPYRAWGRLQLGRNVEIGS